MRRFTTLGLLAASVFCASVFAQEPENPNGEQKQEEKKYVPKDRIISLEHKVSNDRIDKIEALLQKYYDERKDLENSGVVGDLRREIQEFVPVAPGKKADTRSLIAIKDSLKNQVDKKFPDYDAFKKSAEAEAAKKFPLAERNQPVKVFYKRGRRIYSFSGNFYGFGYGGRQSITLNSTKIPWFELLPESKAMFDKKINAELRKQYVDEKLAIYNRQRQNYSEKLFAEEFAKIRKANEKLGYIYQNGQWVTAEMILKQKLPDKIRLAKARAEKERLEKEAREKAKREAGGNNPDGEKKKDDDEDE